MEECSSVYDKKFLKTFSSLGLSLSNNSSQSISESAFGILFPSGRFPEQNERDQNFSLTSPHHTHTGVGPRKTKNRWVLFVLAASPGTKHPGGPQPFPQTPTTKRWRKCLSKQAHSPAPYNIKLMKAIVIFIIIISIALRDWSISSANFMWIFGCCWIHVSAKFERIAVGVESICICA